MSSHFRIIIHLSKEEVKLGDHNTSGLKFKSTVYHHTHVFTADPVSAHQMVEIASVVLRTKPCKQCYSDLQSPLKEIMDENPDFQAFCVVEPL